MAKDSVSGLGGRGQLLVGRQDIGTSWTCVLAIIHQYGNVGFLESMNLNYILFHLCDRDTNKTHGVRSDDENKGPPWIVTMP